MQDRPAKRYLREKEFGPHIPLAPFQNWIGQQMDAGLQPCDVAGALGIPVRTLWRIRHGISGHKIPVHIETWARYRVEDYLHRAGVDFYDLYPEFAHERDGLVLAYWWCPVCRCEQWSAFPQCPDCDEEMSPQFEDEQEAA